jgi:hypothetical protein
MRSSKSAGIPKVPDDSSRQAPFAEKFRTVHAIFGAFSLTTILPVLSTRARGCWRRSSMTNSVPSSQHGFGIDHGYVKLRNT